MTMGHLGHGSGHLGFGGAHVAFGDEGGLELDVQPTDWSGALGNNLSSKMKVHVLAGSSVGTVHYQWQRSTNLGSSWSDLTGKTSATLSLAATVSDAGAWYKCKVTDDSGTVWSDVAGVVSLKYPLTYGGDWQAVVTGWPGTTSASASKPAGSVLIGKVSGYRDRTIASRSATPEVIPALTITGASINLSTTSRYSTLELFGYINVRLVDDGLDPGATASYDGAPYSGSYPMLLQVPYASVPSSGAVDVALGSTAVTLLNTRHGDDILLLMTTDLEETSGGIAPPWSGKSSGWQGSVGITFTWASPP